MAHSAGPDATIPLSPVALDHATAALVRLAAVITAGGEGDVRAAFAACGPAGVPGVWVEEVVLQSYLFAGFPRALNAAREWRRAGVGAGEEGGAAGGVAGGAAGGVAGGTAGGVAGYAQLYDWRVRGEETCAVVYGVHYDKLRSNIRALHPALDDWMIVEGYGKVLSREGLDLGRRELCIVAACAAARQDRQLHSHLLGARNAGVADAVIGQAIDALATVVPTDALESARMLWARVKGKPAAGGAPLIGGR
jgi:4-carboxymuconolactone decarboxylase